MEIERMREIERERERQTERGAINDQDAAATLARDNVDN